jgi:hypothetical protein
MHKESDKNKTKNQKTSSTTRQRTKMPYENIFKNKHYLINKHKHKYQTYHKTVTDYTISFKIRTITKSITVQM